MAQQGIIQRSFGGGELAPALHARADLAKYLTGLRTCKNFYVRKEGGVSNRAGFRYVDTTKDSGEVILLRFVSEEIDESILIEMGNGYFRFFKNGGAITVPGADAYVGATTYEPGDIVSDGGSNFYCIAETTGDGTADTDFWYPMPADDLLEIPHHFAAHQANWEQSGHVLTLTHGEAAPAELAYFGDTSWTLTLIDTKPWAEKPDNLTGNAGTLGPGALIKAYVVTAARADTYEETEGSDPVILTGSPQEPTPEFPDTLAWDAVTGAAEYYVYCDAFANGVYGYIGTAATTAFNNPGIIPDMDLTPPIARTLFASAGEYPNCSGVYQQRRVFASTGNTPDQLDFSRPGFPSNFGITSPLQDDDALRFKIAGQSNHVIRWLVGLTDLIIGTGSAIWRMRGAGDGPLTPSSVDAREAIYHGVHDKRPARAGNTIIYLQARGKIIRAAKFDQMVEGMSGTDLTTFATHLFTQTFARLDYAETPDSIVWAVRNDGVLLGLTYLPDQDVWGWHRHTTGAAGQFEDVCVVPESGEDVVYVVVKRTIDGGTVRYIEKLESRQIDDFDEDCFFVDAGLSYSGSPANYFTDLDHLEGEVVAVVGDGAVVFNGDPDADNAADFTVTGGALTLDDSYENVHIGIPIRFAEIETLDLDVQGGEVRDKRKRVGGVSVLLDQSARTFYAGPDEDDLRQFQQQTFDPAGDEFTGQVQINLTSTFDDYGRVLIRQVDPLPITILGVIPSLVLGG